MYSVRDYGASGDGQALDTRSVQAALDACAAAGGGEVIVPPGRYLCGGLRLRSNTTLNITPGATSLGSRRISDYAPAGPEPRSGHGLPARRSRRQPARGSRHNMGGQ